MNSNAHANCKLWIVTGKGGVGKSTMAASLGLAMAKQGKQVLLVETHGLGHVTAFWGKKKASYKSQVLQDFDQGKLSHLSISAEAALEEYLVAQLKLPFLYNALFKNKYVRRFLDAAPGLAELLTIGKVYSTVVEPENWGQTRQDVVILDSPATGHGLSLLKVPQVVKQAVRGGPLLSKAEQILSLLEDPSRTELFLVTLAEEMPVSETLDFYHSLQESHYLNVKAVLLNALWPDPLSDSTWEELKKNKVDGEILVQHGHRLQGQQVYTGQLEEGLKGLEIKKLPWLVEKSDLARIEKLAETLEIKSFYDAIL